MASSLAVLWGNALQSFQGAAQNSLDVVPESSAGLIAAQAAVALQSNRHEKPEVAWTTRTPPP